jgi:hypothetical protein
VATSGGLLSAIVGFFIAVLGGGRRELSKIVSGGTGGGHMLMHERLLESARAVR